VLVATATVLFSWRYMLPTLLFYPPAGALAWTTMRRTSGPTEFLEVEQHQDLGQAARTEVPSSGAGREATAAQ
jgi:hypothetical protein